MKCRRFTTVLLLLALAFAGCKRRSASGLKAGTWVCRVDYPTGGHFESKTALDPEGHYACDGTVIRSNGVKKTFKIEGTMEIKDGFLVDTWTNRTDTNAPIPHTSRAQILKQTTDEVV